MTGSGALNGNGPFLGFFEKPAQNIKAGANGQFLWQCLQSALLSTQE